MRVHNEAAPPIAFHSDPVTGPAAHRPRPEAAFASVPFRETEVFEHGKIRRGVPKDHIRLASASSRATLLSGIQLVAAHRDLSTMVREVATILLRANRRSPAFRSAIPRRHVVQTPNIRFPAVEKRPSAARQRCGTAEFPEITRSAHDAFGRDSETNKRRHGPRNAGKRCTASRRTVCRQPP